MPAKKMDSFACLQELTHDGQAYAYFSLPAAQEHLPDLSRLPYSIKVLLENLLRFEDGDTVKREDIVALANWGKTKKGGHDIAYQPARVLMQDFTGVPAIADLASMRDAMVACGGDPRKINPLTPVDLVVDHSLMVDQFATHHAVRHNVSMEYKRNGERYRFLKWGQEAFDNFRVVPPGAGICHQVNLEYLARCAWVGDMAGDQRRFVYPDTLVGTDSHTTMVNALGVLGWGVGGIEAEAAMLGQPVSMLAPEVIGFRFLGKMAEGVSATDLVLTVTQILREKGVVGKFVEFCGPGLAHMSLEDRATIANMAPEYGATCGFFPIDQETIRYLTITGREQSQIALVEKYAKLQTLWCDHEASEPEFTEMLSLDLGSVEAAIAGPKRPQDRIALVAAAKECQQYFHQTIAAEKQNTTIAIKDPVKDSAYSLSHGDIVIAAITSCTNTSNPGVMIAAGLLARKAAARGLTSKPWVKTSLAPGSKVVSAYLEAAGLQDDLDRLGFHLVGYGCTTCIGNSGPLPALIADAIGAGDLHVCSVLSGNRNFEGRINPHVRANYLASPPLVVAYAIAGTILADIVNQPLGTEQNGKPVYLADIWPSSQEISETMRAAISPQMFHGEYKTIFDGDDLWREIDTANSMIYPWDATSTYVRNPPYFAGFQQKIGQSRQKIPIQPVKNARIISLLADSVTTDHISPAGAIKKTSPAGQYLLSHQIQANQFNSYGARRGNHDVMMRGTFGNIRIRNEMTPNIEGGVTRHYPSGEIMSIFDAAMRYRQEGVELVLFAGKEYGTGSSRDWAAKGTRLLGIRAVIAESFERIHRSNLIGMGVLALQFGAGWDRRRLKLQGDEQVAILDLADSLTPGQELQVEISYSDGRKTVFPVKCRIDTKNELAYYRAEGILPYVLSRLIAEAA